MFKFNFKMWHKFNVGGMLCLVAAVYVVCYFLSQDDILPISISSVCTHINQWANHYCALAVGLLPIYLSLMIFGTAMAGVYLGSAAQRWVAQRINQKEHTHQ